MKFYFCISAIRTIYLSIFYGTYFANFILISFFFLLYVHFGIYVMINQTYIKYFLIISLIIILIYYFKNRIQNTWDPSRKVTLGQEEKKNIRDHILSVLLETENIISIRYVF